MDGRRLAFSPATFDIVYSLSSIEHFGGIEGAVAAVDEMARVLKPGGVLVLATEYCLSGPPHHEAFQPAEVARLLGRPGLRLVEPLDERVHARYEMAAVDIRRNPTRRRTWRCATATPCSRRSWRFLERAYAG